MLHGIRRVVCGISGGVDSAVAAALLQKQGFDVIGAYMDNWDMEDEEGSCALQREGDLEDARSVCSHLGIPFTTVSFVKDYWNEVFSSMVADYEKGLTPNPDVLCNRFLKFGSFYQYARKVLAADAIATGHYWTSFGPFLEDYAANRRVKMLRAIDVSKDQTLFLSGVHQEPLSRTMFPLGRLYKREVRRMAEDLGMTAISKKRDSVGICFIGSRTFSNFISQYVKNKPGEFVDIDNGKKVGEHRGIHHWTIGQRCRIQGSPQPYYVAGLDPKAQIIYAVLGRDHSALYSSWILTSTPHWICNEQNYSRNGSSVCMFKFQHTEWTIPAQIFYVGKSNMLIRLSIPTRAITPGQQAVFYTEDVCLGSAKIIWADALDRLPLVSPEIWNLTFSNRSDCSPDSNSNFCYNTAGHDNEDFRWRSSRIS